MTTTIQRARGLAYKLHDGQKRDNGNPYTWHVESVARILSTVTSDPEIIAAGYLHDVLEDCEISEPTLRRLMGDRITNLVLEVTKESENCFPNLKTRDAFLIKFADRLQNLSDMDTWTEDQKQVYMNKSIFWHSSLGNQELKRDQK